MTLICPYVLKWIPDDLSRCSQIFWGERFSLCRQRKYNILLNEYSRFCFSLLEDIVFLFSKILLFALKGSQIHLLLNIKLILSNILSDCCSGPSNSGFFTLVGRSPPVYWSGKTRRYQDWITNYAFRSWKIDR